MAQNLDIYIDIETGNLIPKGSLASGSFPQLTRNDSYLFRTRFQSINAEGIYSDASLTGLSTKVGIGGIDDGPSSGAFKLAISGITSSAITYNSDEPTLASSIFTAVSNNVSTVTTYGLEPDAFILTATGTNTALSFSGDSFTLFPTSNIQISTRRFPASGVQAQQVIKLRRNPAVYADSFVASPTAGIVNLSKVQDGSTTANETYRLSIGSDAEGGSFVLNYGTNSTTAIPIGVLPTFIQSALAAVTGIGANNISVESGNASNEYSISFVRGLGSTNITTALSVDPAGVVFGNFFQTTLTMATAELDELFAESGEDTITPTIEIEVTKDGTPKTAYQGEVTVRRDLITTGNVVPGAQASYYTKAEADATFVEDLTTGAAGSVDAANRRLRDSGGTDSVNWNTRKLLDGSTEYLRWEDGLGFYGNSAVAQPSGANAVSNVISLGLIASSATYGVLPGTVRTLTTTASIDFGTLSGHSTSAVNVTVTGAVTGDIVLLGLPTVVSSGPIIQGLVFATNTVCVSAINGSNNSRTVGSGTYRVTVIGY